MSAISHLRRRIFPGRRGGLGVVEGFDPALRAFGLVNAQHEVWASGMSPGAAGDRWRRSVELEIMRYRP